MPLNRDFNTVKAERANLARKTRFVALGGRIAYQAAVSLECVLYMRASKKRAPRPDPVSLHALRGAQAHPYGAGSQFQNDGSLIRNLYLGEYKVRLPLQVSLLCLYVA